VADDFHLDILPPANQGLGASGASALTTRLAPASREGSGQNKSGTGGVPANPLLLALGRKLGDFENALASFVWPSKTDAWFQSRLILGGDNIKGKLAASVPRLGTASNPNKFYSKGADPGTPSGIAAGDYAFSLGMGTAKETVNVSVGAKDTWGDVLGRVQAAVNAAPLPVQAGLIAQNTPFTAAPDLAATGSVLALSVNPARPDQAVTLADTSGNLLSALGVTATANPATPAARTTYQVQGTQLAQPSRVNSATFDANAPTTLALGRHNFAVNLSTGGASGGAQTTYISKAYSPTAATTLAPGDYTFKYRFGEETRQLSVSVTAGMTWNDVLQAVAAGINGQSAWTSTSTSKPVGSSSFSQPGLTATVESSPLPSATTQGVFSTGEVLRVATTAPFQGQDFSLFDGSGGLLSSVGLTAKLTGQPLSLTVQSGWTWRDVSQGLADAIGSAVYGVTAQSSMQTRVSGAVPGKTIVNTQGVGLSVAINDPRIGRRMTLGDGGSGLLASLGMAAAVPGQDGKITVDGATQVSENNTYALDQGRVQLALESDFSNTLPVSVVRSMDQITNNFSDVINSYNNLQSFLNKTKANWSSALSRTLAAPAAGQADNLAWMGVGRSARSGQLWVQNDPFWSALSTDPDRAGQTLAGQSGGLIPAWRQTVNTLLGNGLDSYLKPTPSLAAAPDTVKSEFDLEKKHRLLNLLG